LLHTIYFQDFKENENNHEESKLQNVVTVESHLSSEKRNENSKTQILKNIFEMPK